MALPRATPAKLSLVAVNITAHAPGDATPLVKVCIGPDEPTAKKEGGTRPSPILKPDAASAAEKTLEAWQMEGWTLVESPTKKSVKNGEPEA